MNDRNDNKALSDGAVCFLGQRARVSLARAAYQDADLVFFIAAATPSCFVVNEQFLTSLSIFIVHLGRSSFGGRSPCWKRPIQELHFDLSCKQTANPYHAPTPICQALRPRPRY